MDLRHTQNDGNKNLWKVTAKINSVLTKFVCVKTFLKLPKLICKLKMNKRIIEYNSLMFKIL